MAATAPANPPLRSHAAGMAIGLAGGLVSRGFSALWGERDALAYNASRPHRVDLKVGPLGSNPGSLVQEPRQGQVQHFGAIARAVIGRAGVVGDE